MQAIIQLPSEAVEFSGIEGLPQTRAPMRQGEPCPRCGVGRLDYNGLLDLECPVCGYSEASGAGCT